MALSSNKRAIVRKAKEFRVTDPRQAISIIEDFTSDPEAKLEPISLIEAFGKTVENFPNNKALMFKDEKTQEWKGISYREYKSQVDKIAKVFIKIGLERHGTVAALVWSQSIENRHLYGVNLFDFFVGFQLCRVVCC